MAEHSPSLEVINRTADLLHEAFWWHQDYRDFFEERGVSLDVINNAYSEGKHKARVCRAILKQLIAQGPSGINTAWDIVDEARSLTGPVHPENCSQEAFEAKAKKLEAALTTRARETKVADEERARQDRLAELRQQRTSELEAIRARFLELHTDSAIDPRVRGYELELLVSRLCHAYGLGYEPPKKQPGQQIDGVIRIDGKVLVLETRWRAEKANHGDIQTLSGKTRARLLGALGLFISIEGFSSEGVDLWLQTGHQRNCILMHGSEFFKVVNGYIEWPEALRQMIDQALVSGEILVNLKV